ncbi:MAG: sugar ABC transporter permease [Herpetosiphon sp.]
MARSVAQQQGSGIRRHQVPSKFTRRQWLFAYAMLLPVLAIFVYIRIIPILRIFWLSFHSWDLISPEKPWNGLENYRALFQDDLFRRALRNTTVFAVATVAISVPISLLLAAVMAKPRRFFALYETIYFLPAITPMVPVTVAWKAILDPQVGLLNYLLHWVGIAPQPWLTDPTLAIVSVIMLSSWKIVGYNMIIFLVGIRNIPAMYYEAAAIDGASVWQRFRHITLPLLKPITLFVLVITTINSYNVFTQVYVLASDVQGAPGYLVRVLVYDMWENGFRFFKMGYAAAEAVVLFLIVLVFAFIQFRWLRDPIE